MITTYIISLLVVCLAMFNQENDTYLAITVKLQKHEKGLVQLLLFNGKDGFPDEADKAVLSSSARIEKGKAMFYFIDLQEGLYAVAAFHDTDEDGKMRKTRVGIPKDAYGFSNDARATFSPPSFESASFELPSEGKTITFTLK
jgi:uncharacterized protein (DUF2141 family)